MRACLDPPATPVNYVVAARECIRNVLFILMMAGSILYQLGFYYPLFFFQLDTIKHVSALNFPFTLSSSTMQVINLPTGSLVRVPNLVIIASFLCSVLILVMIGLSSLASVVVLCVVYGHFSGIIATYGSFDPDLSE